MFSVNVINYVCNVLHRAHEKIVEIYNCEEKWNVVEKVEETKTGTYVSLLTAADTESNRIICNGLEHKYRIPIVSEENEQDRDSLVMEGYTWIIDPIDGTKQFVQKSGDFTTNIGLVKNGKPIMGFVGVPLKGLVYVGVVGKGIYTHSKEGNLVSLDTNQEYLFKCDRSANLIPLKNKENLKLRLVCSRSHCNQETEEHLKRYTNYVTNQKGSSLKFILLALGEADVYPRLGPTCEWDTCAAHAILLAGGGSMFRLEQTGPKCKLTDFVYNKKDVLNPYFIAYGPTVNVVNEEDIALE